MSTRQYRYIPTTQFLMPTFLIYFDILYPTILIGSVCDILYNSSNALVLLIFATLHANVLYWMCLYVVMFLLYIHTGSLDSSSTKNTIIS